MRSDAKRNETKRRDATLCGAPRRLSHVFGNPPRILASRQPTEFLAGFGTLNKNKMRPVQGINKRLIKEFRQIRCH